MPDVTRRTFLKALGIGTFTVVVGNGVSDLLLPKPIVKTAVAEPTNYIKMMGDWCIDAKAKKLIYKGNIETDSFELLPLYRDLMDLFDDPDMMQFAIPMTRATDTIFHLHNEWEIEAESMAVLHGGSVVDEYRGNIWSNLKVMGEFEYDATITVIQDGTEVVKGNVKNADEKKNADDWCKFDALIKTKSEGNVIDGGKLTIMGRGRKYQSSQFELNSGIGTNVAPIYLPYDLNV